MQTPPEIEFQGIHARPDIQAAIARHVADLEQRFSRVTACRVVLKGPGGHHKQGGLYEVNIRLALPDGREVNIDHTPQLDERHSDLDFAINDAFKRARRQLQDQARELQGQVKHREGTAVGTIVELDPLGEFGRIKVSDGQEIYFHRNSVLDGAYERLSIGSRVSYAEETGDKGPQASTVKLLEKHSLRV